MGKSIKSTLFPAISSATSPTYSTACGLRNRVEETCVTRRSRSISSGGYIQEEEGKKSRRKHVLIVTGHARQRAPGRAFKNKLVIRVRDTTGGRNSKISVSSRSRSSHWDGFDEDLPANCRASHVLRFEQRPAERRH